jgi:hypothetical protein
MQNWAEFIRITDSTQFNRDWYQKRFSAYGFAIAVSCKRFLHLIINAWWSSFAVCQPGQVQPAAVMNNELCFDNAAQLY